MTNYKYVIFMFFLFMLGKNICAIDVKTVKNALGFTNKVYLTAGESKKSTLPVEPTGGSDGLGINSYRYLNVSFQKKLFAFQRVNVKDGSDSHMALWTSSDNGVTWSAETKIPCNLTVAEGACDVISSMVISDELIVIYGNQKEYAITKTKDGSTWEKGTVKSRDTMSEKEAIYYSGNPSDSFNDETDKNLYIMCYMTDEQPSEENDDVYKTLIACSVSKDNGETWNVNSYVRVKADQIDSLSDVEQISIYHNQMNFIATIDSDKDNYFNCMLSLEHKTVFHCENVKYIVSGTEAFPVVGLNASKQILSMEMKTGEAYIIVVIGEDIGAVTEVLTIKAPTRKVVKRSILDAPKEKSKVESIRGKSIDQLKKDKNSAVRITEVEAAEEIKFHNFFVSESEVSVIYEYKKEIYNVGVEMKEKKRGCHFVLNKKKEEKPTNGILDDYTHVILYDDVNSESDKICPLENFEPALNEEYVSFFVKVPVDVDFETSENCFKHSPVEDNTNESAVHKRSVIKIKNVVTVDEDTQNKMKEIEFFYPAHLHKVMKYDKQLTCASKNLRFIITYNFKADDQLINLVSFTTVKNDFTIEENRLALKDYKWNDSVPETPLGAYVLDSAEYMKRFQVYADLINNTPTAVEDFTKFSSKYPVEFEQNMSLLIDGAKDYDGIDFTDSSKHYEVIKTDIQANETFEVKVVVPEEGKTVGLLCPLENSTSLADLHCFDIVSVEDKNVPFEVLFEKVPFVIAPKTMVYNQKLMAVESLLHLNADSYNELNKIPDAIHFQCACKVNTHTVTVKYAIGTSSSSFTPTPIDPEDPLKPGNNTGKSTRSILSSVIVLLVLLNVFSYTSF